MIEKTMSEPGTRLSHVIYVSKALTAMDDLQLAQLLAQCRELNQKRDVTGMLLYKSGRFMQVIEGEESVIRELIAKIQGDSRHTAVDILGEGPIATRDFPDWSMGFSNMNRLDLSQFDGFSDFMNIELDADYLHSENLKAHEMLLAFKRELWERV